MLDVNQTRFHLVLGEEDWCPLAIRKAHIPLERRVEWSDSDATFGLRRDPFIFTRRPSDVPLLPATRRGAGQDRYGNWYWIGDRDDQLWFRGTSRAAKDELFWPSPGDRPTGKPSGTFQPASNTDAVVRQLRLQGLAVTTEHYLVVGMLDPSGLLIFDLHGGGPPEQVCWPEDVPFTPFDMCVGSDGGVWILDRDNHLLWHLDRYFRLRGPGPGTAALEPQSLFQPSTGSPPSEAPRYIPTTISVDMATRLDGMADPIALESLPDGTLLVLDNDPAKGHSSIWRIAETMPWVTTELDDIRPGSPPADPFPLRGHDIAFLQDRSCSGTILGTLYVANDVGTQVFPLRLSHGAGLAFELDSQYLPLRAFTGKALVASNHAVYYDTKSRWARLVEQPRPRYPTSAEWRLPSSMNLTATSTSTDAFDGKEPGCVWHRVLLDACIPPGAAVAIRTRAADSRDDLPSETWCPEPAPYLRPEAEVPFYHPPFKQVAARAGTWEVLIQRSCGRYLQVELILRGTGRNSPHVHAVRIYYPRFSYLQHYLPDVYRRDAVSASFLDRYLANVEGMFTGAEGKIANVEMMFDPRTADPEYLDWLGGWLGVMFDLSWPERTRRLFLAHAPQFFRERGTPSGVLQAIRLSLDPHPDERLFTQELSARCDDGDCTATDAFSVRVVEQFLLRRTHGVVFGDPTDVGPLTVTDAEGSWDPSHGAAALDERFRQFLERRYRTVDTLNPAWGGTTYSDFDDPALRYPGLQPTNEARAVDWRKFSRDIWGVRYARVGPKHVSRFRHFLRRRYASVTDLNRAYGLVGAEELTDLSSGEIQSKLWNAILAHALPANGTMLHDWLEFATHTLPTALHAHRFTVLVPVTPAEPRAAQLERRRIAERVTKIAKPAHTAFDVKLYWAMFRVGEARVGLETILGDGGRTVAIVLGQSYLGEGHLGASAKWHRTDRTLVGRDRTPHRSRRPEQERLA